MNLLRVIFSTCLILCFYEIMVFSQADKSLNTFHQTDTVVSKDSSLIPENKTNTSIYFELFGKYLYSINIDVRIKQNNAFGLGFQLGGGGIIPNIMYFHFFGLRNRFETGLGISGIFDFQEGIKGMGYHAVIGYRNQKRKSKIFRIGFTPMYQISYTNTGKNTFVPLAGLSLGYTF